LKTDERRRERLIAEAIIERRNFTGKIRERLSGLPLASLASRGLL
jgi:hypothetical protein